MTVFIALTIFAAFVFGLILGWMTSPTSDKLREENRRLRFAVEENESRFRFFCRHREHYDWHNQP